MVEAEAAKLISASCMSSQVLQLPQLYFTLATSPTESVPVKAISVSYINYISHLSYSSYVNNSSYLATSTISIPCFLPTPKGRAHVGPTCSDARVALLLPVHSSSTPIPLPDSTSATSAASAISAS